jgi:hypothetical protein
MSHRTVLADGFPVVLLIVLAASQPKEERVVIGQD